MNLDYDIVWNGVNDGRDGDLLVHSARVPDKQMGAALRADYADVPARVYAVLSASRLGALTLSQIIARTGAASQSVNSALYRLRHRGQLASETIPGEAYRRHRPPQRYWRRQ